MRRKQEWQCFLGIAESHQYTLDATSFTDLKRVFKKHFDWLAKARWYKQTVEKGLPSGAMKFILKGSYKTYLLIIPPRPA